MKLKGSFIPSRNILPVCYIDPPAIEPNIIGVVTGWGFTTETGRMSEKLKELQMPYNDARDCFNSLQIDFARRYFISDKICAGFNNRSTSVCRGDSGGGLVFKNPFYKNRYFIHGIVSLTESFVQNQEQHCNIQKGALFTKVDDYIEWIQLEVSQWKSKLDIGKSCFTPPQPLNGQWTYHDGKPGEARLSVAVNTTIHFTCKNGYQLSSVNGGNQIIRCTERGEWSTKKLPNCKDTLLPIVDTFIFPDDNQFSKRPSVDRTGGLRMERKSEKMCKKIYEDNNIKPEPKFYILNNDKAKPGEFPHVAALGFLKYNDDIIQWNCGASLISTRFLLSAAHCIVCSSCVEPTKARFGTIDINDTQSAQDVDVKNTIVYSKYSPVTRHNDIALIELVRDVTISERVYPACLYTKDDDPSGLQVVNWNQGKLANPFQPKILQYSLLRSIPVTHCNATAGSVRYSKVILESQICTTTGSSCLGDSGTPLQISKAEGGFAIVGITSYGLECDSKTFPDIYTRVASYLDWIEENVWPN